jgi:hypothetical protein
LKSIQRRGHAKLRAQSKALHSAAKRKGERVRVLREFARSADTEKDILKSLGFQRKSSTMQRLSRAWSKKANQKAEVVKRAKRASRAYVDPRDYA